MAQRADRRRNPIGIWPLPFKSSSTLNSLSDDQLSPSGQEPSGPTTIPSSIISPKAASKTLPPSNGAVLYMWSSGRQLALGTTAWE